MGDEEGSVAAAESEQRTDSNQNYADAGRDGSGTANPAKRKPPDQPCNQQNHHPHKHRKQGHTCHHFLTQSFLASSNLPLQV